MPCKAVLSIAVAADIIVHGNRISMYFVFLHALGKKEHHSKSDLGASDIGYLASL